MVQRLKSIYVTLFGAGVATVSVVAAARLVQGWSWSWFGAAVAAVPAAAFFAVAFVRRRTARTADRLLGLWALGAAGTGLALYGVRAAGEPPGGLLAAAAALASLLVYDLWYARLGRRPSELLVEGRRLPDFPLVDLHGQERSSTGIAAGHPTLFLFYRGNWCPICVAQIREVAADYRALAERGVRVALVSPQSQAHTQRLAAQFEAPMDFYEDRDNRAARSLSIATEHGVPMGFGLLGYDSETVLPTAVLTAADGTILLADQTDNYRVRPEPATFLRVLDAAAPA